MSRFELNPSALNHCLTKFHYLTEVSLFNALSNVLRYKDILCHRLQKSSTISNPPSSWLDLNTPTLRLLGRWVRCQCVLPLSQDHTKAPALLQHAMWYGHLKRGSTKNINTNVSKYIFECCVVHVVFYARSQQFIKTSLNPRKKKYPRDLIHLILNSAKNGVLILAHREVNRGYSLLTLPTDQPSSADRGSYLYTEGWTSSSLGGGSCRTGALWVWGAYILFVPRTAARRSGLPPGARKAQASPLFRDTESRPPAWGLPERDSSSLRIGQLSWGDPRRSGGKRLGRSFGSLSSSSFPLAC